METVAQLFRYLSDNPIVVLGAGVAAAAVYLLLNKKPKGVRDADRRIEELRKDRADYYRKTRPPR